MTVTVECPCGAELTIDDASELTTKEVVELWQGFHREHRRTIEEYRAELDHRRTIGRSAVGICGDDGPDDDGVCILLAGHEGWHHSSAGSDWDWWDGKLLRPEQS